LACWSFIWLSWSYFCLLLEYPTIMIVHLGCDILIFPTQNPDIAVIGISRANLFNINLLVTTGRIDLSILSPRPSDFDGCLEILTRFHISGVWWF
jgi:hypothetical protein